MSRRSRLSRLQSLFFPSRDFALAVGFVGLLLLGGLLLDEFVGQDSGQIQQQVDTVPKVRETPRNAAKPQARASDGNDLQKGANKADADTPKVHETPQSAAEPQARAADRNREPESTNKVAADTTQNVHETPPNAARPQDRTADQSGPQRGTIERVDAKGDTLTLTLNVDGEELAVEVTPGTRVVDSWGKVIESPARAGALAVGSTVVVQVNGQTLVRLRMVDAAPRGEAVGQIRRGTIASIDLDKLTIHLRTTDKIVEAVATEQTRFFGLKGRSARERLQILRVGTEVRFLVRPKDGKNFLVGLGNSR